MITLFSFHESRKNSLELAAAVWLLASCRGSPVGPPLVIAGGTPAIATTTNDSTMTVQDAGTGGTGVLVLGSTSGGYGGAGTTAFNGCKSNAECVARFGNRPGICKENQCVVLTDKMLCPMLIPGNALALLQNTAPEYAPIVVGGFSNMNMQSPADTQSVVNWSMAMDEFNKTSPLTGLNGFAGGPRRPIIGLICYSTDVPAATSRLAEDVGVSAILSVVPPSRLLYAYQYTTTSGNPSYRGGSVFFMNTGSADSAVAATNTHQLVWNMLGDPSRIAGNVARMLRQMEPYINKQRAASGDDPDLTTNPLRVTLITSNDSRSSDIGQALISASPEYQLWFNNRSALAQGSSSTGAFRTITERSTADVGVSVAVDISNVLSDIQNHPPHVIVAMATSEFAAQVIGTIESKWNTDWSIAQPRPYYILSPYLIHSSDLLSAVAAGSSSVPPLSMRIVGANYASAQDQTSKALYDSYQLRLNGYYHGPLDLTSTENMYDAAYYLLYSIAAAASTTDNPDGNAISAALINRIISDTPTDSGYVYVNPYGNPSLATVISKLSDPEYSLSLWGTMGAPNFDKSSGTRISPSSVWCIEAESASNPTYVYKYDGLLYDPMNQGFTANADSIPGCLQNYCPTYDPATRACSSSY